MVVSGIDCHLTVCMLVELIVASYRVVAKILLKSIEYGLWEGF